MNSRGRFLLTTFSGVPLSMNRFIPDPGLGLLASVLVDSGAFVRVLDFSTLETFRRCSPKEGAADIHDAERQGGIGSEAAAHTRRAVSRRYLDAAANYLTESISAAVECHAIEVVCFKPWLGAPMGVMNRVVSEVKRRHPSVVIALGGPTVTALGPSLLPYLCDAVDLVTFGPGEHVLPLLADYARNPAVFDTLPRTWRREAGRWRPSGGGEGQARRFRPTYDPAIYPAVAEDLLPAFVIENQRGCAMRCPFCTHPAASGGALRNFSADVAYAEIQDLNRRFGARVFRFSGSCSTPNFFTAMAKCVEDNPRSFLFSSFFHPEHLEQVDMTRLIRSGWCAITLGIEAVDANNQRVFFDKELDLGVLERFESAHGGTGIYVALSLIYPALFECAESVKAFLRNYPIPSDRTSLALFFPVVYPGTPWWEERARFGISLADDEAYLREIVLNESLLPPFKRGGVSLGGRSDDELRKLFSEAQSEQSRHGISRMVPDEVALLGIGVGEKPNAFHARTSTRLDHFEAEVFAEEFASIRRKLIEPREGGCPCPPS